MSIKRFAIVAVGLVVLLTMAGAAGAGTVSTSFDSFTLGTVNLQDGWKSSGGYDQAVVANGAGVPAAFGTQSLRMSNAVTSGEFSLQTYSEPTTDPAGEGLANHVFDATFQFTSTSATQQTGLALSVSPDSYEGSRMQYVRLEDHADGIHVFIDDTPLDVNPPGYTFRETDAGVVLDRTTAHTIRFLIELVPGENNDIVRIFIDGHDIGQELGVCFTTWENYYRLSSEQNQPPNNNTPPNLNSLQFRSAGTAAPALAGGGYLYDNVSVATRNSDGPEPTQCGAIGAFCSPGYWKNASDAAWTLTGLEKSDLFNSEVVPDFYANPIDPGITTLWDVLTAKGANKYGKAADPFGLNPFNAVGAALTSAIPGYVFDPGAYALSLLGIDTCPLDHHGNVIVPA